MTRVATELILSFSVLLEERVSCMRAEVKTNPGETERRNIRSISHGKKLFSIGMPSSPSPKQNGV